LNLFDLTFGAFVAVDDAEVPAREAEGEAVDEPLRLKP